MPGPGRIQLAVVDQSTNMINKMAEYIESGSETVIDIAVDLSARDATVDSPQVKELQQIMLDYCKMDRERTQFLSALEEIKQEALEMGPEECLQLDKMLQEHINQKAAGNSDAELRQHRKYLSLIEELNKKTDAEEPESAAAAEPETLDESMELAVTQQDINTKCPYTGLEMKHPVKNKHCNHKYDRDGINEYIKSKGRKAKCPVSGCINHNPLIMADLEEDKDLKNYINKKNRAGGKRPSKRK